MCILALEPLVERERLEAGEADQVGMFDFFGRNTIAAEQFGADFGHLMKVKHDRRIARCLLPNAPILQKVRITQRS